MAFLLFFVLIIIEIGFAAFELTRKPAKKEWTLRRLAADVIQLGAYLITILLPGIDFGFRFKCLVIILVIRIVVAAVFALVNRKNENTKKAFPIIVSAVLSFILILAAMAPAFIFTDYNGRPLTGQYSVSMKEAILIDLSRKESFETDGSYREVPVHLYYPEDYNPEDTAEKNNTLPLVVFSHGAFGYYQSNSSAYLELASHGYVVVSLDHPYHSFFTKDSDGKTILVNRKFISDVMSVQGDEIGISEEELYEMTSEWVGIRMKDMNFVIDTMKDASNGDPDDRWCFTADSKDDITKIVKLIDPEKIGLFGHSLGGAASVTVGRRDDVSAVIDLDGTMLGEETGVKDGIPTVREDPYTTPLLCIDSQKHHEELESEARYVNSIILKNDTDAHEIYIEGAKHMDFTDLPLFAPFIAKMLGSGDLDSEQCIDQVNAAVLKFFDCYLKDEGKWN